MIKVQNKVLAVTPGFFGVVVLLNGNLYFICFRIPGDNIAQNVIGDGMVAFIALLPVAALCCRRAIVWRFKIQPARISVLVINCAQP